jgi:hypothetical protein
VSGTRIDLAWTDNSTNETGFSIERSPAGAGSWTQIATVGTNVTSYQNTGLSQVTAYDYRVRAYNSGNSGYSNTASATTANDTPTAADVQIVNGGSTVGKPELGDTITLTYSEAMSPSSMLSGWNGSSANVVVRITNTGNTDDTVTIWNSTNSTQVNLGTVHTNGDYVTSAGDTIFGSSGTPSTMVMSGNTVTITLGTLNSGSVRTDGNSNTTQWNPSTSATDLMGTSCSSTAANESGILDDDF